MRIDHKSVGRNVESLGLLRSRRLNGVIAVWWPVSAGLALLYIPTFFDLATGLWRSEGYEHCPIILGLSLWLLCRQFKKMSNHSSSRFDAAGGWCICLVSLSFYALGRSQSIMALEIGSLVLQLAAVILIVWGRKALYMQWFPLVFMFFVIPLPEVLVSAVTLPMKIFVAGVTERLLFTVGYPIARSGVILQIGQYQLQVADACSGLQSLLTLEILGMFYLNLVTRSSLKRNISLALLIVPISFLANVIRVITLSLITFHFGEAAGQGFLHTFAGMILFMTAMVLIIGADAFLHSILKLKPTK